MTVPFLSLWTLLFLPAALAQSPSRDSLIRPDTIPDELQTLVVGTRFVALSASEATAKDRFLNLRVPASSLNETDHCIDQAALELAQDYFNTLGRSLSKAGHYYFVSGAEINKSVTMCERLHGKPPKAWDANKTEVIAYGKRVLTTDAAALELSLR